MSTHNSEARPPKNVSTFSLIVCAFLIGGAAVYFGFPIILPESKNSEHSRAEEAEHSRHSRAEEAEHSRHSRAEEAEHSRHSHAEDESDPDALALNVQALANIGIELGDAGVLALEPRNYRKTFSIPAFVRYKPGRSLADVPSPVAGTVVKIFAEEGEALCPGDPLFEIQLAREEVASCQLELVALLQKRDLLESEAKRLETLDAGVAPKAQREIALQLAENAAAISTQKETLRFLGVPLETVDEVVVKNRSLISSLIVRVPAFEADAVGLEIETATIHRRSDEGAHFRETPHFCQLEKTLVEKGESVSLGSSLCVVSDLRALLIEGRAFESDEARLNVALAANAPIAAIFPDANDAAKREKITDLTLRSVANRLDPTSRTVSCFVELSNYPLPIAPPFDESQAAAKSSDAAPRLNWRFKPGQRCELLFETETLENVFVLPVAATAQEGPETFLFERVGEEDGKPIWRKRPVVVLYRTADEAVIANDGSVKVGAKVVARGATQLYVALANGGGKLQSACPCGDHDH